MRRRMRRAIVLLLLAASACARISPPPPPPPPPPPVETAPPPAPTPTPSTSSSPSVIVKDRLVRGRSTWATVAAPMKSVVLLSPRGGSRNQKVCDAYRALPSRAAAAAVAPDLKVVPTLWLLYSDLPESASCKDLLAHYDFEAATVLLQVYGRPTSKGPVLLVADDKTGGDQRFAFIDMTHASKKQIAETVPLWFRMMSQGGLVDTKIRSNNIAGIFGSLLCNTGHAVVADHVPAGADPTSPATFGYANGRWKMPSIFQVGALIFGGPFVSAACSAVGAS